MQASAAAAAGTRRRASHAGFILLEVMTAVVILGIACAVLIRSFIQSMHASRQVEITLRAGMLAQAVVETLDLFPPEEGKISGSFGEDPTFGAPYQYYFYEMETEVDTIDYKDVEMEGMRRDFVPLRTVRLRIIYDDGRNRRFVPIDLKTCVIEDDPFSPATRRNYQLF